MHMSESNLRQVLPFTRLAKPVYIESVSDKKNLFKHQERDRVLENPLTQIKCNKNLIHFQHFH